MEANKRSITAEDLYQFELISGLEISPDGEYVIYAQGRVDQKTEKKYSNLWAVATTDGPPRQFTYGEQSDRSPRWSPDGSQIAFISNRGDEKQPQIYLIPFHGGEARPLTALKGEFGSLSWSPDGKKLLLQFRKKDAEAIEREADEQKQKLGIVERHIERLFFKLDGSGFLPKERWHIWLVDAASGAAEQLTDGPVHDETNPVWSADGRSILYLSNRSPDPDLTHEAIDLFVIPAEGGAARQIDTPFGQKHHLSVSPDGQSVAYLGREGKSDWWKNDNLWLVPLDGSSPARDLTHTFDFNISQDTINDTNNGAAALEAPVWSPQGERLYFQVSRHGSTQLYSIRNDGTDLQPVIAEKGVVGSYSLAAKGQKLSYFFGNMTQPGDIWSLNLSSGKFQQLTHTNAWLAQVDLGTLEEVWFKGRDSNNLQGWILKPPGFDPQKQYPSIMEIHGGPLTQYGEFFMHEFFYLAAQDYVVYFSNPRGGQGYGEEHAKAIWGCWGDADYADLMLWADHLRAQPYIDPDRMGVTGGSYGGYMTLWIIGHTHQFKSAVAQRVVSNFVSMWGSSDLNWVFQEVFGDQPPYADLQSAWERSPMAYIGNAQTPTLIIHSEHDHRCPIEQGEQAFVALKTQGIDSEMVRFPEEPHGLSRSGRTDRRIARLNHILRWMDKYLK